MEKRSNQMIRGFPPKGGSFFKQQTQSTLKQHVMARQRIKKGTLIFSTNIKRAKLAEEFVVEVNYEEGKESSYTILGKRKHQE